MRAHTTQPIGGSAATWNAVVLTTNESHFAGRVLRKEVNYIPPGLLHNPAWLLDQVSAMFAGEGTLIVPQVPGPYDLAEFTELPYPEQLRYCARLAAPWSTTSTAADNGYGWLTFTRTGRATVHMGILPHIKIEDDQLIDPTDSPARMAELLARYQAAVGIAWQSTAGVAGVNLIRTMYERPIRTRSGPKQRRQPLWVEATDPAMTGAGDIMWSRRLDDVEKAAPAVAQFDIRMAYGAAAGIAELPVQGLGPTGAREFDPAAAGYWRIIVPKGAPWARNDTGRPPIINPSRIASNRTAWITTPLMLWLSEQGANPEVIDSATTEHTDRVLREWYEKIRDARVMSPAADSERLSKAIKATCNSAIGMMRSGRGRIQRRIWADTIMDLARANQLRKLHDAETAIGTPFRIEHDSCWYTYDPAEKQTYVDALKIGPQMGRFRVEHTWTMGEYLEAQRAAAANRRKARR